MRHIQLLIKQVIASFGIVVVSLWINIAVNANDLDTDGDGLPDIWEDSGIDINDDGLIDFFPLGANPLRKDVFLEIDYMDGHFPGLDVINSVRAAFENAPVSNPDGSQGITLHILIDEAINHQNLTTGVEFFDIRQNNFGTEQERPDPAFPFIESHKVEAKAMVYHYAIIGHQRADQPNSSGAFYELNTFVITLGGSGWGTHPVTGHTVGSFDQRSGTLMHELGHSLGLNHGGDDGINCKPNYLSVMSYSRQFTSPIASRPLDYSRSNLNSLNESFLSEPQGIEASTPAGLVTVHGPLFQYQTVTGSSIDWNQDGDTSDIFQPADINRLDGVGGCGSTPNQILMGHDDWANLQYATQLAQEAEGNKSPKFKSRIDSYTQRERKFKTPTYEEITINDVVGLRLLSLGDINRALQQLPNNFLQKFPADIDVDYFVFGTNPNSSRLSELIVNGKNLQASKELSILASAFAKREKSDNDQLETKTVSIDNKIANLLSILKKSQ